MLRVQTQGSRDKYGAVVCLRHLIELTEVLAQVLRHPAVRFTLRILTTIDSANISYMKTHPGLRRPAAAAAVCMRAEHIFSRQLRAWVYNLCCV